MRLSGAVPAVEAAARKIGGASIPDGAAFWRSVREQTHPYLEAATGSPLWRLSVKASAPHADLGGDTLIEWSGALRWLIAGERTEAPRVRAWAQGNGGHATLFRAADKSPGAFHPLTLPLQALHRRIKAAFDPNHILNPAKIFP